MNEWNDKKASDPVKFKYTNHRGETAIRTVKIGTLIFGVNQYHKEPQWHIRGWDVDKLAVRSFALKDCDFTTTTLPAEVTDGVTGE